MTLLSKVEHAFEIEGLGCVIAPGAPYPSATVPVVRKRDQIQLRTPDGRVIDTYVASIELISGPAFKDSVAIRLPKPIRPADIPAGTEVWYKGEDTKPNTH